MANDDRNDPSDGALRRQLRDELGASHAHVTPERAFAGIPHEQRGVRPPGQPHTLWGLLEHLRIAQWDIAEFSRGPDHASPKWPEGYWPESDGPRDEAAWEAALHAVQSDRAAFCALLDDPARDLFAPFPWGDGQTLLRE